MALTRVQGTGKAIADAAAAVSVTFATAPTIGHGIVVGVVCGINFPVGTVTDTYGNPYVAAVSGTPSIGPGAVAVFYCSKITAAGSAFTITYTPSNGAQDLMIVGIEISADAGGLALHATALGGASFATTATTGVAAVSVEDTFELALVSSWGTQASIAVAPGWTQEAEQLVDGPAFPGEVDSRVQTGVSGTLASCTWTFATAAWGTAVLAVFKGLPATATAPPVSYEDPCTITRPRIFQQINTGTDLLKVSPHALRDPAALGGFAEPRLLEVGPITRIASDPVTGAWSAQTASTRWADTDHAARARSEARTSFRSCDTEIYLTSHDRRVAGLPPRVVFAGKVYADTADQDLVHSQTLNDLIGTNYSLFSEEKQIPQRTIEIPWFPHCPAANLGVGEPIVGGRRAPLDPATNGEGVSEGVFVGQVQINGARGRPDATTLADIVAALNASGATHTIYVDWGSRIGYADAINLQNYYNSHGTVPTDYDGLAHIIGYSDLDHLLAHGATTGGSVFVAVVVASHAIAQILPGTNGEPSVWIDNTQLSLADLGTTWWAPQIVGDASWATDIGADAFTDIVGANGVTRRYTLVLFDPASSEAAALVNGGRLHLDLVGLDTSGAGTGTALTDYFALYLQVLVNFILEDYQSGAWLPVPQFIYSDGSTRIDRVDAASFTLASAVAAVSLAGGRLGSFTIKDRVSVREIIATFNLSGGARLAEDDFGRLRCQVLDTRRTPFLTTAQGETRATALRDKVDILPGFWVEPKPEWQTNLLRYQYALNGYTNHFERGEDRSASPTTVHDVPSQQRDGVLKKTIAFKYVTDDATALDVATYYLQLLKDLPHVAHYGRRGLCGLEDDVLDGRAITHYNGYGPLGWRDHAVWILSKTLQPTSMHCEFTALDVEARIAQDEGIPVVPLVSDPVGLETLISDQTGVPLVADA